MKTRKTITPSQAVNLGALLLAIALPGVIATLQAGKVHIDPLYAVSLASALTVVAGGCRSFLTKFSGTNQGLFFGTDLRSIAANAEQIAGIARKILGASASPFAVNGAVNTAINRVATGSGLPDITGQFTSSTDFGTKPGDLQAGQEIGVALALTKPSINAVIPAHSGEPFPVTSEDGAEQPPPPVPGSIREIVSDWALPASAKSESV